MMSICFVQLAKKELNGKEKSVVGSWT